MNDRLNDRLNDKVEEQVGDHESCGGAGEARPVGDSGDVGQVGGSVVLGNDKLGRTQSSGAIHIEADSCVDQGGEWQDVGNQSRPPFPGANGAYPAVGTYGAWVNVMNMSVPAGMSSGTQGLHDMTPYMSQGLPRAGMYPVNMPSGYIGQPYAMPTMMYMPMPHIAPRLAPPFIDRHKSGSSGRGTGRSPRYGAHTPDGAHAHGGLHETKAQHMHPSSGYRDQVNDQTAHRTHGHHGADHQAGVGSPGADEKARFFRDVGSPGSPGSPGLSRRPSQPATRVVSNQKPCAFFLQHGSCAFGSKCKFSHPIELAPVVEYNSVGLPRRYGQPTCRYYVQTGRCSYGYTCRYDHPDLAGLPGRGQLPPN